MSPVLKHGLRLANSRLAASPPALLSLATGTNSNGCSEVMAIVFITLLNTLNNHE